MNPEDFMPTGQDLLKAAEEKIGFDYYLGADVPLEQGDDYEGPYDCAEFITERVHEVTGEIYGALNPESDNPEPWTGEWYRQMKAGELIKIDLEDAYRTPGAILLRKGHIAMSDGKGGTVEAKGRRWGVCRDKARGRFTWALLIPGVKYEKG